MSQGGKSSASGSGGPPIESLVGNSGGPVFPDAAFNIDILGNNTTGIDIVGTPASSLLTVIGIASSTTQIGTLALATDAEAIDGTVTDKAIVPSSLAAKLRSQTIYGLAIGNATTGALNWTVAGTDGQIPIAATGADPAFASLTSTGATIVYTPGANTLNLETAATVATSYTCDTGSAVPALGVLTVIGAGSISTSGAGSTVTITGSGVQVVTVTPLTDASSPYVVLSTDYYMTCNVSGGPLQINLPNAPTTGTVYIVKDSGGNAATNNITVTTVGGVVNIDGATTFVMNTAYEAATFLFNGSAWEIF